MRGTGVRGGGEKYSIADDDNEGDAMVKDRTNADEGGEHSQLPTSLTNVGGADS